MQWLQLVFQFGGQVQIAHQATNPLALFTDDARFAPRLLRQHSAAFQLRRIPLYQGQRGADIVRNACDPLGTCPVALLQHRPLRGKLAGDPIQVGGKLSQHTSFSKLRSLPLCQRADALRKRRGGAVHAPTKQQRKR